MDVVEENLVRVSPDISIPELSEILNSLYRDYDHERQVDLAKRALNRYDLVKVGQRFSQDIESLRNRYNGGEE